MTYGGTPGRTRSHGRRAAHTPGFTLVELMVVVAIVGVLAMLSMVGYRKWVSNAHRAEVVTMVNSIRSAQEAFRTETGGYASVSTALCTDPTCASLYPQGFTSVPVHPIQAGWKVGNFKTGWGISGSSCTGECAAWLSLPLHEPGGVMYGYSTVAGKAGVSLPSVSLYGTAITWPANSNAADWFLITAVGDTDESGPTGSTAGYATFLATSFSNDIVNRSDEE